MLAGRCCSSGVCSLLGAGAHDDRQLYGGTARTSHCLRWGSAVPAPTCAFAIAERSVVLLSPRKYTPLCPLRRRPSSSLSLPRRPTLSFCSSCGSASHTPAITHSAWAGQLSAMLVSVPYRAAAAEGWEEQGTASQGPSGDSRHSSGQPGAVALGVAQRGRARGGGQGRS